MNIKLINIQKRYDETVALRDINLEIKAGESISVMGPSGSGKSSLVNLIAGTRKITEGEVEYNGNIVDNKTKKKVIKKEASTIKITFQNPNLQIFTKTVFDEFMFPLRNLGKHEDEASMIANVFIDKLGLTHLKDRQPHTLSSGEKRKVVLGSLLVMDPEVIIVDEPTAFLDEKSVEEFKDILNGLNKEGKTIIVVTHDVDFAKAVSTRTIIINDGSIVEDGSTENILSDEKILIENKLKYGDNNGN